MELINGKYALAKVFTVKNTEHSLDQYARAQLQMICDNPVAENSKIRVMPDVHPGKVGTIGLTMTVGESIMPSLTGIDLGCGVSLAKVRAKKLEWGKMDTVIREGVPSGSRIRSKVHHLAENFDFSELKCAAAIRQDEVRRSLGTLGGGNHFIEADRAEDGSIYIAVHSGSRHLGKEVTEYYLNQGQRKSREQGKEVPYELTCLTDELLKDYLHDVQVVQKYAALNREIMLLEIMKGMKMKCLERFDCIHNYIDEREETVSALGAPLLRKGAISALTDEQVLIPVNMRDGIILGRGLGNEDWNLSAPHGSGRLFKREEVANHFTVSQFKKEMKGIYSSCVGSGTLDEAPFAYRSLEEVCEVIGETVEILQVLRPVYNFKAAMK